MALQFKIQESNSQITPQTGCIELYGLMCSFTRVGGSEDYDLSQYRLRTFFNHHFFMSIENVGGVYSYYGTINIQMFQGAGGTISAGYDDWRSPVRPPRIDSDRFCSEVIIYPPNVTLTASVPSAYDGRFQLAGLHSGGQKIGRYGDIAGSYSYIPTGSGYIYNPLNWVMEKINNTKTRSISSISTIGNTVTVVTSTSHGYNSGDSVTITGLNSHPRFFGNAGEKYEGNFRITVTGSNSFTYTTYHTTSTPSTHTTGTVQIWEAYVYDESLSTIQGDGAGNVTVTFTNAHNFRENDLVAITGTTNYNGTSLQITSATATSFVCKIPGNTSTASETSGTFKFTGRVPSSAVSINYPVGYEQINLIDHTTFTYFVYSSYDSYIDNTDRTNDYSASTLMSVHNFTNSGMLQQHYSLLHFPVAGIPISLLAMAEVGLYYDSGDDNGIVLNIYQCTDPAWYSHGACNWNTFFPTWMPGDAIPPTINPLFDPSDIIATHSLESVNQAENNTYVKIDMTNDALLSWLDGSVNPDIVVAKITLNTSIVNKFRTSNNTEKQPYIIISSGVIDDQIPPTLVPIDTQSEFAATSAQGDGAGNITVTTPTEHQLSAGGYVDIVGSTYVAFHVPVVSSTLNTFVVYLAGNTSIVSEPVFYKRYDIVDVYFRATDDTEVSDDPADTIVRLGASYTQLTVKNLTKVSDTVLTFDVTVPNLSDGYFDAKTTDALGNVSSTITPPILFNWRNSTTGSYQIIKPGQNAFVKGLNIESALEVRISDSALEGGLVSGGYSQSIGLANIDAANNGFTCSMPSGIQLEYNVTSIDDSADTITIANCSLKIGDVVIFNTLGTNTVDPIKVGHPYIVYSATYSGADAIIQISSDGINPIDIQSYVDPFTMYAYNATTTLYVIKDGYNTSEYNSTLRMYVDSYGPKIKIEDIVGVGSTVNVVISDIYPINQSNVTFTNGTVTSTPIVDVNGDGTVLIYEVIITGSGTFRVDAADINSNTSYATATIPAITLPYIQVTGITINSESSFMLNVKVITDDDVPAVIASDNSSPGVFVEGNIANSSYGVISNMILGSNQLTFNVTVNGLGAGVMKIYATTNSLTNDSVSPIVITSVSPSCQRLGTEVVLKGVNFNLSSYTSTYILNSFATINSKTMTQVNATITSVVTDGLLNYVYAAVTPSGTSLSNTLSAIFDNTGPLITVLGSSGQTTYVTINTPYVDLGATALDNISGDVSDTIITQGTVDVTKLGTYYITYTAVDNCGNESTATRTVYVVTGCPIFITVSPDSGYIGDTVRITTTTGEFNPIPANNVVMFNGIVAQIIGGTRSELLVTVPYGATSGYVQVETGPDNTGYEACSLSNVDHFDVTFDDETFPDSGLTPHETQKRASSTTRSGRISPFERGAETPAIYNRDMAYSGFNEVTDENSMVQNVYSIVLTRKGERMFNASFGVGIENLIHQIIDDPTRVEKQILDDITTAVSTYEPRVIINRDDSFVYYDADINDIQIILSLLVPSGNVRVIGITLKAMNNGASNI